jgi:adenylate cyclase
MTEPDETDTGEEPDEDTPTWTAAEVAERTGVSPTAVRRLWLALGFPDVGDGKAFSPADLRAVHLLVDAVVDTEVDLATGIRLARAIGQNVARLSDWQVAALAARAEQIEAGAVAGGGGADFAGVHVERAETSRRIAEEVGPALEGLLAHAWRRHLRASLTRLDADPVADDLTTTTVTVGFADLVAFSALSNELDAGRLGELVEIFEARSADVVAAHDGRMIKTLGDSVLFVAEQPEQAVRVAGGLIDVIGGDARLPDVRIGLASGPVVVRMGDVFGPPVNLAARLTAIARRNRVLVDEQTAKLLDPLEYDTRRLTARPLRGFGLVEPVAVRHR